VSRSASALASDEGQEREETSVLNSERKLALVFGTHRAPAASSDACVRVEETADVLYILVINLRNIVGAKVTIFHTS